VLLRRCAVRREAIAAVAALIGLPMFFEIGVVLLVPMVLLVAQRSEGPLLRIGIPALAGLSVLHGLVPPHPGPLAAIANLHADLGLTLRWRALALGAVFGAVVATIGVLVLRFPPLLGGPVTYMPLATVSDAELARHVVFYLPLSVVLPEELAFRGALLGALRAARGMRWAVAGSAFAFGLWHGITVLATVVQTNLSGPFFALGIAGAFAVVFAGGVAFALLRLRTRSLLTTIGAHWAFNAVVLAGLRA